MIDGRSRVGTGDARSIGLFMLMALVLIAALRSTGLPDAIDDALRSMYYGVASSPESTQRVLLVEADDDTIEEWNARGWDRSHRHRTVVEKIAEGRPAAVVVIDEDRMFTSEDRASWPDDVVHLDLSVHIDPGSGVVDVLDSGDLDLQRLTPAFEALELPATTTDQLWINYLSPPSRLPSVPVHRVAEGDVPSSVFMGKVVVLGLTSRSHRDALATPVGAMTSPEIVSHALAMLADGRNWSDPAPWMRGLALLVVLLGSALAVRGTSPAQAVVRAVAIATALIALDLIAFIQGWLRWGVSSELLVLLTVVLGSWYLVQQRSAAIVERVSQSVSGQLRTDGAAPPGPPQGFWQEMAEVARAYLEVEFQGVIAELPAGAWHLELRAFMGMTEDQIVERRRDVRRPPYRTAFLTHRTSRCERRFIDDGDRVTLAVPLAHQGRLFGMWMICLAEGAELDDAELETIDTLGAELGRSIAAQRRGLEQGRASKESVGNVATRLSHLVEGVAALGEGKQQVVDTFEALPMGLLIADVWGRIGQINASLRAELSDEFPDGVPNSDLAAVLSRLTGRPLSEAHELMRSVVRANKTFRLRSPSGSGRKTVYMLMPMRREASMGSSSEGGTTTHLVLMTVPEELDAAVDLLIRSA